MAKAKPKAKPKSQSVESDHYLSPSTEEEGPFALDDRYRHLRRKRKSMGNPLTQPPKINMLVDGPGLRVLADITVKAEAASEDILLELTSSTANRLKKCLTSAKNRAFINTLNELKNVIASTAEEVRTNPLLFKSIEPSRTAKAYKHVCKAMRGVSQALSKMTSDCGHQKFIRVCRKYVVRVLRRIHLHYAKLVYSMEREVKRVWAGPRRYGDDINAGSLLKGRIADWIDLEPRLLDKLSCSGPEFIKFCRK